LVPLYDYRCTDCQQATEVLQSFGAPAPKACPHCGSPALVRQLGSFAVRYGSGGFYNTDYRPKKTEAAGVDLP
jgi:putative FmdB family regulatory protein